MTPPTSELGERDDREWRVTSDRIEIRIAVEKVHAIPDRHRCDEAVGQTPDRGSRTSTCSVEGGSTFMIGGFLECEEAAAREEAAQLAIVLVVASSSEDL
jgi:hypothetical protein